MLALLPFLALVAAPQESLRDALERRGWELCETHAVPGAAMALVEGGRLAWVVGVGWADVAEDRPVEADTVFNIGSISKTVAAWGLMREVEAGRLSLDAPVAPRRWTLPPSDFDVKGVTLRRLLSHTAGLSLHGYPGFWPGPELPSLEASLGGDTNGAGEVRIELEPGTRWQYSGGGYTLAQLLLEESSGEGFAGYLRAHVLDPLGMTHSDYGWTERVLAPSATPYDERGEPLPRGGPRFTELAAAGLQTTAGDLARFALAAMPRFRAPGDARVLGDDTIEAMQRPAPAAPEYGLGYEVWRASGLRLVGHGGANMGWMARLSIAPDEGAAIVILTNGSNGTSVLKPLEEAWIRAVAAARDAAGEGAKGR